MDIKKDDNDEWRLKRLFTDSELDYLLLRINKSGVNQSIWEKAAMYPDPNGKYRDIYFMCIYLQSYGFVTLFGVERKADVITEFKATITNHGIRFIFDGGFRAETYRKRLKERAEYRWKWVTITVSIMAVAVSAVALFKRQDPIIIHETTRYIIPKRADSAKRESTKHFFSDRFSKSIDTPTDTSPASAIKPTIPKK